MNRSSAADLGLVGSAVRRRPTRPGAARRAARAGRARPAGELEGAPGRGDRPLGGRDLRRPVLRDQLDGRRRAGAPGLPGRARAWTWSSSTPACTSRRRCGCATRWPARCRSTCARSGPRLTVGQQDGEYGPRLFSTRPDECCFTAQGRAAGAGAGRLRRLGRRPAPGRVADPGQHAGGAASTPRRGKVKVNPIAAWTQADVDALHRPLERAGQRAVQAGLRLDRLLAVHPAHQGRGGPAGRAAGPMFEKTECGLHV